MTKDQKLEKIKEKVVEACPEVMELGFGCEILVLKKHTVLAVTEDGTPVINLYGGIASKGTFKIIGHPITLEHILKTASEKWRTSYGTNPVDGKKHINVFGGDRVLREGEVLYSLCSKWTLGQPLSSQTEETISFIYEILK